MGRNFLEICNEVLDIMVYNPAEKFEDLDDTTEGRMVKKLVNRTLRNVCGGEQEIWKFREKEKMLGTLRQNYESAEIEFVIR